MPQPPKSRFLDKLQAQVRVGVGASKRQAKGRALRCGGAPEGGDVRAALEPVAQLVYTLGSVGAVTIKAAEAAELVAAQAASKGESGAGASWAPTQAWR